TVVPSDSGQEGSRVAGFENHHDLIGLGAAKVGLDKLIPSAFGSRQDRRSPLPGALLHPLMVLAGNLAQQIPADRIELAVAIEEAHHPLRLLKRLNQPIEQQTIKATILQSNVILMMLVKGVHGILQCVEIP